jgi:hypothetical protein
MIGICTKSALEGMERREILKGFLKNKKKTAEP